MTTLNLTLNNIVPHIFTMFAFWLSFNSRSVLSDLIILYFTICIILILICLKRVLIADKTVTYLFIFKSMATVYML